MAARALLALGLPALAGAVRLQGARRAPGEQSPTDSGLPGVQASDSGRPAWIKGICADPLLSGTVREDVMSQDAHFAMSEKDPAAAAPHGLPLCDKRLVTEVLTARASPASYDRCALVGSSVDMHGRGLGREIDSHDTVIRVNRVPTFAYARDFGRRTDVLFTAPVQEFKEQFSKEGQYYWTLGGSRQLCRYADPWCPFKSVVLKGSDSSECGLSFASRFPPTMPGWKPPAGSMLAVAHQSEALNRLAYLLMQFNKYYARPTNGFHAFLTFSYMCNSLDVYGFSGNTSVDAHEMKQVHSLPLEHRVLDMLANQSSTLNNTVNALLSDYEQCLAKKRGKIRFRTHS